MLERLEEQTTLRVLIDRPQSGIVNMAIDEAILQAVAANEVPATMRFYRWSEPTISLGYFQKHDKLLGQDKVIQAMAVVRRQTGGGAILHDDELTYALILPLDKSADIEDTYRLVHDAFCAGLAACGVGAEYRGGGDGGHERAQRGPFFCFARTHRLDLMIGNDKLLGSAQRRIKNAVLQHGSLILDRHFTQQPSAAACPASKPPLDVQSLIATVAAAVSKGLGLRVVEGVLTGTEQQRQKELHRKYAGDEWNRQR